MRGVKDPEVIAAAVAVDKAEHIAKGEREVHHRELSYNGMSLFFQIPLEAVEWLAIKHNIEGEGFNENDIRNVIAEDYPEYSEQLAEADKVVASYNDNQSTDDVGYFNDFINAYNTKYGTASLQYEDRDVQPIIDIGNISNRLMDDVFDCGMGDEYIDDETGDIDYQAMMADNDVVHVGDNAEAITTGISFNEDSGALEVTTICTDHKLLG